MIGEEIKEKIGGRKENDDAAATATKAKATTATTPKGHAEGDPAVGLSTSGQKVASFKPVPGDCFDSLWAFKTTFRDCVGPFPLHGLLD